MNNKAIETFSVNAVRDSIVICDYLDQFIADNDKEPSWDGFVYIYKDKTKKKNKLKGRVAVQVKGKESNIFPEKEITYRAKICDLKNYLYDGGAIYFVVYLNEYRESKIYYAELTPIKLRKYIDEAGKKETKEIKLKAFPEVNNHKAAIFSDFYENCLKQASFVETKLLTIEELEKLGILEEISISWMGYEPDDNDLLRAITRSEVNIYAKIKGCCVPQPLENFPESVVASHKINNPVLVNNTLFVNFL